ncbi:MAG: hypothetical protein A2Y80_01725 [Deltaproteobacteria bacterium RBG_13_58_19]|nr:MAG: hypothetical protein A2Y80_01725 [Deltaproteobacteria bacterium RBG_13_58_19]
MLKKVIPYLVLLGAFTVLTAAAQTRLTYVGKIQEIASKTGLTLGSSGKYLALRLDSQPKLDFRLTVEDGVRFGLIEETGTSAVLTPGRLKGLGWKVRLTCEKKATFTDTLYWVTNLERLD